MQQDSRGPSNYLGKASDSYLWNVCHPQFATRLERRSYCIVDTFEQKRWPPSAAAAVSLAGAQEVVLIRQELDSKIRRAHKPGEVLKRP